MLIRPATTADTPALVALLCLVGMDDSLVSYNEFTPPVLVAEHEGQVIAFLQALLGKPVTVMTDMVVHPTYSGRGVGRTLLAAMECLLSELGVRQWSAFVREDNLRPAKALVNYGAQDTGLVRSFLRRLP